MKLLNFRSALVGLGALGILAGAAAQREVVAQPELYACKTTSSCGPGTYNCRAQCQPGVGCSCTISDP
jgi:hypothetical protein